MEDCKHRNCITAVFFGLKVRYLLYYQVLTVSITIFTLFKLVIIIFKFCGSRLFETACDFFNEFI